MKIKGRNHSFVVAGVLVVLIVALFHAVALGQSGREARVDVFIRVPVMQTLSIDTVHIPFTYPWAGAEADQPLVLEGAISARLTSNVPWIIRMDGLVSDEWELAALSNDPRITAYPGQPGSATFFGDRGLFDLSWDVLVQKRSRSYPAHGEYMQAISLTVSAQ